MPKTTNDSHGVSRMKADCPGCGRSNESITDMYWCPVCQCQYDDDPDEGGAYSGNDPVRNVINKEEFQLREKHRRRNRPKEHAMESRRYRR